MVTCMCIICISIIYIIHTILQLSITEVNIFIRLHANWDAHTGRTSTFTCSDMFRNLMTSALGPCSLFLLSGFFSFFFLSHPQNQRRKCESFYWDSYCCQLNIQTESSFAISSRKEHELTISYDALYIQVPKHTSNQAPSFNLVMLIPCGSVATAHPVSFTYSMV